MNDELTRQLFASLERIKVKPISLKEKIHALYTLLNIVSEEATADENMRFPSLFARLSYLTSEFGISKKQIYLIHQFRIKNEKFVLPNDNLTDLYQLGLNIIHNLIDAIWGNSDNQLKLDLSVEKSFLNHDVSHNGFRHLIEALVIQIDYQDKYIIYLDDDIPGEEFKAEFDIPHINEPFTPNILSLEKIYELPIHVNLIDCEIHEGNVVKPKAFVIRPDYLMDVTSVAAHADRKISDAWLYGLNKFKPRSTSKYLMLGNIVNYLLDVLISKPDVELDKLYKSIFLLFPIDWAVYEDSEIVEIISLTKLHFSNLKRVIQQDFQSKGILVGQIYLEPAFYCRDYGIQGRLDLFHINKEGNKADIVELKSGSVFMPNSYGINQSHYTQTLLYDMMITSAYSERLMPKNYILYSKLERLNLKFAPRLKTQQYGMIITRNNLVAIEHSMSLGWKSAARIMNQLSIDKFPDLRGFELSDLSRFEEVYQSSSELEKIYFTHFVSFVSREMILAKTGEHGLNKSNGLAGLWLENIDEKIDRFGVLNHLQLIVNDSDKDDPFLVLRKTNATALLSNFRKGDIAVLYPHHHNARNILRHQIFKCSIISITEEEVRVRLRSPQFNQEIFRVTDYWNIEQDVLTSSFNHMFRSLRAFLETDSDKKSLLLGLRRPVSVGQELNIDLDSGMTAEQKAIVYKAFNTKDYLLIWGPPGTGKTSVVLKNLVAALQKYSNDNILLLAYTNRAVDEICEALIDAGLDDQFVRIGSRYSVGQKYQNHILESKLLNVDKRKDIVSKLKSTRIYVSTVASILGKSTLFQIVNFDTVIIDEASQILEPMIIGLLPKFRRIIMIGDHKQLPAVVTQEESLTSIDNKELNDIGLSDMRVSLFERLYNQCKANKWDNGLAVLTKQGRMHEEIMSVVNDYFYEQRLYKIPGLKRLISKRSWSINDKSLEVYRDNRIIYIDSPSDEDLNWKTNRFEAEIVIETLKKLISMYQEANLPIKPNTIGIITPYRAQIAMIRSLMNEYEMQFTVDTVERYQGGARDVIILSLCTNRLSQLQSLVSMSAEGIDRKLNVALTRAKEQIVIIGNRTILSNNETYKNLINNSFELKKDMKS